ncbi:STAS domain-containing protein [Streptomyces sp. NPDC000987]|uniref:STAS domain-containing protein n=1 Tax=Streptomyces sp. NPDC000987 TaxID=3154374 RepID=UPI003322FCDC
MAETHSSRTPDPTVRTVAGRTVVALRGEIDVLVAPSLSARLDALTSSPSPDVVVDLRAVSFIDCSGLGVLCRVRNRVLARDGRLRLVSDDPGFLRLLRPAGLAGVFHVCTRLSEALTPGPEPVGLSAAAG